MVTNWKSKTAHIALALGMAAGAAALCVTVWRWLDEGIFNGVFLNWIYSNYMHQHVYTLEGGVQKTVYEPIWPSIKVLLLLGVMTGLLLCMLAGWGAAKLAERHAVRRADQDISRLLRAYLASGQDAASLFSHQYAQVAAQAAEIRALVQRHEQDLRAGMVQKSTLVAYLAHDLKTPLASVTGYLCLLEDAPGLPEEQKKAYLHIALEKAQRLGELIEEFFEIARYDLHQMVLEKEFIDLVCLLFQLEDECFPMAQAHGNTIAIDAPEHLPLYADGAKLARVFHNVLQNALSYSTPGTPVHICAHTEAGQAVIFFRNEGRTIPPHKLKAVFDAFYRLDDARATNTGGAGLGLAIAKEIVMLHGGTICVQSEKGITTFTITLPLGNAS